MVSTVTTVVAVSVTLTVTEAQKLSAQFAGGASSVPPNAFATTSTALRTCVGWPYNASVALPTGFSLDIANIFSENGESLDLLLSLIVFVLAKLFCELFLIELVVLFCIGDCIGDIGLGNTNGLVSSTKN